MGEPQKGTSSVNPKEKKSFLGISFVAVLISFEREELRVNLFRYGR